MLPQREILSRFTGEGNGMPLYVPDLTLWYDWHQERGTLPQVWLDLSLPQAWRDLSLPGVAKALGVPVWLTFQPWRLETPGVEILTTEQEGERIIRSETAAGTLEARWILGPDGDWWQTEYPVKGDQELAVALELVEARSYVLDTTGLSWSTTMVGEDGILALEIPRRPYSDLLHEFLGWGDGLLLLGTPIAQEMMAVLEAKLQALVVEVARLPGDLVFSPDNLDGQFISRRMFEKRLLDSYKQTVDTLHAEGKRILVHAGGPIRHLLALLAEAGVDGIEGIAPPPQGNTSLAEARELAGPEMTLWGGIAQDYLPGTHEVEAFEAAVRQAVQEAKGDRRVILGVADRVPVNAELSRLAAIPGLIEEAQ
jgi:hypothetical protein